MLVFTPAQRAFLYLSLHAKLHQHLDGLGRHHRDRLAETDSATGDASPVDPADLAAAREELLRIRFSEE